MMNRKTILAAALLPWLSSPVRAADDELRALVQQLGEQVARLQQETRQAQERIRELEARLLRAETPAPPRSSPAPAPAAAPAAAPQAQTRPAVTAGDTAGTFKLPGTDTSIGFGGFVKLDANLSSASAGRDRLGDQYLIAGQIPVGSDRRGEHGQLTAHAKDTRFWLKSFTPSGWGDINTYLELDLRGSDGTYSYTPRLRHGFGSIGRFLAGQTWTTFLNTAAIPDTLDINGPVGALNYTRQPQLRWTRPFSLAGAPLEFQFAAESPRLRLWSTGGPGGFTTPNADRYPDLVARLGYSPEWGSLSLSALGRHIRYTRAGTDEKREQWGGAVSLAGRIDLAGLDNLRFMAGYGDALGRYATIDTFTDAVLDGGGRLRLVTAYSAMLAYQHWWSQAWRSTAAYGFAAADQPDVVAGELTRQTQSAQFNLLWSPTLQTTFGLEYTYALRERADGRRGDLHRLQFSSRFNF